MQQGVAPATTTGRNVRSGYGSGSARARRPRGGRLLRRPGRRGRPIVRPGRGRTDPRRRPGAGHRRSPELPHLQCRARRPRAEGPSRAPRDARSGWEPVGSDGTRRAGVPLPARLAVGPRGRGRTGDRAGVLRGRLKRVAVGGGARWCSSPGEPGQGKTTLVVRDRPPPHEAGCHCAPRALRRGVGRPYRPFAEALGALVTHADEAVLRGPCGDPRRRAGPSVPALPASVSGSAADQEPPTPTPSGTSSSPPSSACSSRRARTARGAGARRPALGRQAQPAAAPTPGRRHTASAVC